MTYLCALCGDDFELTALTRRALRPHRTELVCVARCAPQIDRERGLQPVSRAAVGYECRRCGEVYGGDAGHVCAVEG